MSFYKNKPNTNRGGDGCVYVIEGAHVRMKQIADKLSCSLSAARARMKKARLQDGPVTWERLGHVN